MNEQAPDNFPKLKDPSVSPGKLVALVGALALAGLIFVLHFASHEEEQERNHWQNKLNLIADSRAADVSGWLDHYFHDLGEVANNPSLQLYVTTLESTKGMPGMEDPAQAVFLRNLLLVTADRLGFLIKNDPLKSIDANVHRPSGTGLAILDNNGKIIVSTEGLPSFDANVAAKIAQAPRGQSSLIDMFVAPTGETRVGFVLPIYPIQGDATAAQQLGKLVGIKTVDDGFLKLLQHPGATEKTLEALLVQKDGDNVAYLPLPQASNAKELASRFLLTTPNLDSAYAITHPGEYGTKRDRQQRAVLMTSRPIANSPWLLLLHIDRDQALAQSDSWRAKMVFIMILALCAMSASIVAAWWYGTSRRATLLSVQTGRLAAHSVAQEKLLRLVTDNQHEPIFIADAKNIVRFANEKTAKQFKISLSDIVGKNLAALMGPGTAEGYIEANRSALSTGKSLARTPHRVGADDATARLIRSEHIPLPHIPIDSLPYPSPGVLVVEQDVTEVVSEREKRLRILRQLIGTLVHLVDARDPHAANHSASVALVAHEVAHGMGLDAVLVDTAQIAGNLMNIGKIVVPSEILTKTSVLGKGEVQAIRDSMQSSVDILKDIDFDGPVTETLAQAQERFDGKGPMKLKGEEILITARIIAVANAFVGMISQRSYRAAISIEQATTLLLKDIDTQFDRRVVVALINFVENKQGREMLADLTMKKTG